MVGTKYLECMLVNLPAVKEVCVIPAARTDARHDYRAFVVLAQCTPSAVYEFQEDCALYLAGISVKVEILPELPKSPMGRVSREELLALCAESAA